MIRTIGGVPRVVSRRNLFSFQVYDDQAVCARLRPYTSPGRPRSWRTFAPRRSLGKLLNLSLRGVNCTIALAPKSVNQTRLKDVSQLFERKTAIRDAGPGDAFTAAAGQSLTLSTGHITF